ncbi:MAG TPA: phosphoribosylformylglycinamidine synthase I [Terriglobia bacterium]|nr:phosphoribosylformylglycinamidine synthase I [Terriglobia bacterium]
MTAILYAPGTNCHEETAAALRRAGVRNEMVFLRDLLDGRKRLTAYQAAVIPGGFSYGDHLGAGRIFAMMLVARLRDQFAEFLETRRPLLGICNGFQVLAEAGILPSRSLGRRTMALLENQSAHFEDRKVQLAVSDEPCIWTEGLAGHTLEMPSAHGEGRALLCESPGGHRVHIALRYAGPADPSIPNSGNAGGQPRLVAGITDETGFVLGLMPHPERASLPAHYSQDGLKIFENLARWLK